MPNTKVFTQQAKMTLNKLHAELAGKILDNKAQAARLVQSMKHVEAVLKLLDPAYNVRSIAVRRRKSNPWFPHGTVFRSALNVLRTAGAPLTAREIADRLLATKGVTNADRKGLRALRSAINMSLQNHKGRTVKTVGESHPARWAIS